MNNIKTYEAIAREAGFSMSCMPKRGKPVFYWIHPSMRCGDDDYNTLEEAWKACCVENGLCEGLEERL